MKDMQGKVALITGASSGIGRASGELFAARGANVVLAARTELLSDLVHKIESQGAKATYVVTDVSIAADVERMVGGCREEESITPSTTQDLRDSSPASPI